MATQDDINIPTNLMDHPAVRALYEKMVAIDAQVDEFKATVGPIAEAARNAEKTLAEMKRDFEEQLRIQNLTVRELSQQAASIRTQMADAQWERDNLSREAQRLLDELRAEQERLDQESKWDEFMDMNSWLWSPAAKPFQMSGIKFMAGAKDRELHGVLNADQMGLGKTLQATATLDLLQAEQKMLDGEGLPPSAFSVLWLCPASIKNTTVREIDKWSPERPVMALDGAPGLREQIVKLSYSAGMTLVCNYEQLRTTPSIVWEKEPVLSKEKERVYDYDRGKYVTRQKVLEEGVPRSWSIIILDEAHKFKNEGTSLFPLVETVCTYAGLIFPMTGTPIQNRPEEFWAILHMLTLKGKYAGKFADKQRFIDDYCYSFGYETTFRPAAADALMKNVSNMVIRRRKDEVLKELPPKVHTIRTVVLSEEQRKFYDMMRDRFFVWLDEQTKDALTAPVVIAQFTRLRQLALYPAGVKIIGPDEVERTVQCEDSAKLDEALELFDELHANGQKVLVFSSYKGVLDEMKRRVIAKYPAVEVGMITGDSNSAQKAVVEARFTDPNDSMRVCLGTIRAMGVGLNLQGACSDAIFLDLDWNPGANEQAEDRLHRQGQVESVNIHIIQAERTIDAYIAEKLRRKIDMIEGVIERDELRQALDDGLI